MGGQGGDELLSDQNLIKGSGPKVADGTFYYELATYNKINIYVKHKLCTGFCYCWKETLNLKSQIEIGYQAIAGANLIFFKNHNESSSWVDGGRGRGCVF